MTRSDAVRQLMPHKPDAMPGSFEQHAVLVALSALGQSLAIRLSDHHCCGSSNPVK
jgi:hypothetical protein